MSASGPPGGVTHGGEPYKLVRCRRRDGGLMEARIEKSEDEWARELTPEQYEVLRRHGTERPFTGRYVYEKASGMYRCAACGNELFSSDTKFDSGTGWPSFTEPAVGEAGELRGGPRYRRTPPAGV